MYIYMGIYAQHWAYILEKLNVMYCISYNNDNNSLYLCNFVKIKNVIQNTKCYLFSLGQIRYSK